MSFFDLSHESKFEEIKHGIENGIISVDDYEVHVIAAIDNNHMKIVKHLIKLGCYSPSIYEKFLGRAYFKCRSEIFNYLLSAATKRKRLAHIHAKIITLEKMQESGDALVRFYADACLSAYKPVYLSLVRPKIIPDKTLALKLILKPKSLAIQMAYF
jgi:hypothetical protein